MKNYKSLGKEFFLAIKPTNTSNILILSHGQKEKSEYKKIYECLGTFISISTIYPKRPKKALI